MILAIYNNMYFLVQPLSRIMSNIKITLILLTSFVTFFLQGQVTFEENSLSKGLEFDYKESLKMGGGAASFDYDNDGYEDLYIVGGQNPDGLFRNDGNGSFTDMSELTDIATITNSSMTTSVITGDIDNDGIREIFIGTIGTSGTNFESLQPNILLKYNPVTSTYVDITESSLISDISFCMGAHFFDADLDGYLDLYLVNYVSVPSTIQNGGEVVGFDHECYQNKLYINNGNGTFSDKTIAYGLDQEACSLAATSSDLDWDGDLDLIVANDFGKWLTPNQMFQNQGKEIPFLNISQESNTNAQMYGMGIAVGDYDEDLDLDFYVTNIGENAFFENSGNMVFQEIAEEKNIQNATTESGLFTTGWGAMLEDFDNDSHLDLFVSNGYVYSVVDIDDLEQNDELYLGNSDQTFEKVTPECGINFLGPSRGALTGDWNYDGHLDLITITNERLSPDINNSINYYTNKTSDNNWLRIKMTGTESNKDAYGSKVILYADNRALLRENRGGSSHASQSSSSLHFGLAQIQEIDSMIVYWPSGLKETYLDLEINNYHEIIEGTNLTLNKNNQILSDIIIYPNPAKEYINIEIDNENKGNYFIQIFSANGKRVLTKTIKSPTNKIDTSRFQTGLYRILVISDKNKFINKNISIVNR